MSLLDRILPWRKKALSTWDVFREYFRGLVSASGKAVNADTAVQVSAVFACCRVIGNGMAQVPLKLMRESKDGKSREPAKDHPLYVVLTLRPNAWQTSFEFRQMISWHVELCGNAFVFINRGIRGKILELIPFEPGSVTVKRASDWTLSYEVRGRDGTTQTFPAEAIWHLRGPTWDGWNGMKIVNIAREAIGLAMATEEQHARMHKNGVQTSGIYSVEGTLNEGQYKALRDWIEKEAVGLNNSGKPMILDRSAKWLNTSMTGVDSQHLETRKHQIEEVCRFFGTLPIMVGYSDKTATYASAEEMFRAHKEHCLSPRWEAYEQSMNVNLLTDSERAEGLYVNFVEEGMIRGSVKDTKDAILGYVNGGVLTPNEGRALLDMNPDADSASDKLRVPANIVGAKTDANTQGAGNGN